MVKRKGEEKSSSMRINTKKKKNIERKVEKRGGLFDLPWENALCRTGG